MTHAAARPRCRVCRGYYKTLRRAPVEAAGFCSTYCARKGREMFHEYVAPAATRSGRGLVLQCECRSKVKATPSQEGKRVHCLECGMDVWVPPSHTWQAPSGVVSCLRCGRNVKAAASRCMYCGGRPIP